MIDLFDLHELQPADLAEIVNKYTSDRDHLDVAEAKAFLKEVEAIGYTFEYQLDGIPFNLRKK